MAKIELPSLAEELIRAAPRLDVQEQRVAVGLYRLLAEGQPLTVEHLAQHLGLEMNHVRQTLVQWPGVFYDEQGGVVGFWGLAIPEMPHRFVANGSTLYTWCAWDSLFIPQILGRTAEVNSRCPTTKQEITLTVGPDGVRDLMPSSAIVSFLAPRDKFDENVHVNFCHFVHFFASHAAGAAWTAKHPDTFLLSVDEAFELGRRFNAARFGDVLRSGSLGKGRRSARASC